MTKEYFDSVVNELCENAKKITDIELIKNGDLLLMRFIQKNEEIFSGSISINSTFDKISKDELSRQQVADFIVSEIKPPVVDDIYKMKTMPIFDIISKVANFFTK